MKETWVINIKLYISEKNKGTRGLKNGGFQYDYIPMFPIFSMKSVMSRNFTYFCLRCGDRDRGADAFRLSGHVSCRLLTALTVEWRKTPGMSSFKGSL